MSFLTGSAHLHHRTALPPSATLENSLEIFTNHDILIKLDPDFSSYEVDPNIKDPQPSTKYYIVHDHMAALPAGIWDTTVSYRASITNVDNGVKWLINAPLGMEQRSSWTVEQATKEDVDGGETEGRLVLVEDVQLKCSRLILGTVKSKCETHWHRIHAKWLAHLADVEKGKDGSLTTAESTGGNVESVAAV